MSAKTKKKQATKPVPYPTSPLVSTANVVFIGGINSTGQKGWNLAYDGYNCAVPKMPSHNVTAITARMLPCIRSWTGIDKYLEELRGICLSCTKEPDIVVGVSQGGAVAMSLAQSHWKSAKLLLVAPAWKTFGVKPLVRKDTVILHGTNDWVIPMGDSVTLRNKNKCTLLKVNDNHHLSKSYDLILREVDRLSVATGKHKPDDVIRAEWKAYHEACKAWRELYCTKSIVTTNPLLSLESVDGKVW